MHPDSFSAPMTCAAAAGASAAAGALQGRHDLLFHVIYGHDPGLIAEFVLAGAARLHSLTGCPELEVVAAAVSSGAGGAVGMDTLRALFFLVLNVDMPIKEYICSPGDRGLYATAVGVPRDSPRLEAMHSYSVLGTRPMERPRARRFMLELGGLVRAWLSNEALTPSDLMDKVKEEYLVS